jgi:hypothetical protein
VKGVLCGGVACQMKWLGVRELSSVMWKTNDNRKKVSNFSSFLVGIDFCQG